MSEDHPVVWLKHRVDQAVSTLCLLISPHQTVSPDHLTMHQAVSLITLVMDLQHQTNQTVSIDHTALHLKGHTDQVVSADHLVAAWHQTVSPDHQIMYPEHPLCLEAQAVSTDHLVTTPEYQMYQPVSINHQAMSQQSQMC